MKLITKLSMFAIIIIMTACSNKDGTKEAIHPSGSDRHTFEYIKKISVTQPKQALRLLQTAENKNLMSELDINALRCLVYYNSMLDYNKATHYAEMALSDSTINSHPQQLQSILHICSLLYYNSGDYTKCLSTVKRGIDVAYKHANRKLVAQLLMIMGQCHNDIGSTWHALNCFDRAITILEKETKGKPNWSTCYYLTTANALKANALLTLKNYGKLLEQADEYKAALKSLNSMHEEINGVNDLSNATFYSIYATGYEEMGYGAKGEDMYDKLLTTRAACTTEGAALLAPYLIDKKRYAEALKKLDDMEMVWQRNGQDTVNFSYINNILTDKARALQGLGRYREAMQIGMRAYELRDSLNRRIHNQNAMMIAEQLGKQMLKHYIERQDNIVKVNHLVIAATLMLLVTCMVGLILIKRKNKILKDKEQSLLSLTEDLMKYKIKLMNLTENETSKKSGGGGGENYHGDTGALPGPGKTSN